MRPLALPGFLSGLLKRREQEQRSFCHRNAFLSLGKECWPGRYRLFFVRKQEPPLPNGKEKYPPCLAYFFSWKCSRYCENSWFRAHMYTQGHRCTCTHALHTHARMRSNGISSCERKHSLYMVSWHDLESPVRSLTGSSQCMLSQLPTC